MNFKQKIAQVGVTKIFLMLLFVVLFSFGVFVVAGSTNIPTIPNMQRGHMSQHGIGGLNVTWEHVPTYNLTKQEFILDVSQIPGNTWKRKISPSLYLLDTSFNLTKLNTSNLEITAYGYQPVNKYSTLLGSCSQSTQTIGNGTNATTSTVWNYPNFCTYKGERVYKSYNGSLYNYNAVTVIYKSVMIGSGPEPVADSMFKKSKMMKHQNGKHSRVGHIQLNQIIIPAYTNNLNSHKYLKIIINNIPVKRLSTGGISTTGTFFVRINGINYWDKTHSSWWNNTFLYKEQINFTANVGQFSYLETIPYSANMNSDFSDIRFVDTVTETTEYNYTIESYTASTSAIVRIYSQGANSVMMYYGNSGATTTSSASDTYFNPVSYYYLDGNANDAVGTNDGTISGATSTTGYIGGAYSFSGSNIDIGTGTNSQVFSFSSWIYMNSITWIEPIIGQSYSATDNGVYWGLSSGKMQLSKGGGATIGITIIGTSNTTLTNNTWYFVSITYDASGDYAFYLNGVPDGSGTNLQTFTSVSRYMGEYDGEIPPSYYFDGKIDELGIWNKALTSTEISELYNQTAPTFTIGAEQGQNTAPTITANISTPSSVYTNTNWKINLTATDPEQTYLNAWTQFYVNNISTGIEQYLNLTNNTNSLVATFKNGNFSKNDILIAEVWVGDRISNSSKINLTTTVLNTAPIITNPQTIVIQNTSSSYIYDYNFTDLDGDNVTWSDNTTLFNINSSTGVISDTPTETETGNYTILITASDGTNSDTDTFEYVIKDTTAPKLNIVSPLNITYLNTSLILNYTSSDINLDTTWYEYNGTNKTLTGNTTFTALDNQQSTLTLWANDSVGNINSSSVTFTINTLPPTITIIQPTTADMNIHNPTLSVSLNLPGSCKYNIDNGANISMGSGTFLNSVITVQNGQRTINVFCNNSILPTESHNSVSFWVYVSAGPTGGSSSGGSGTFENGTGIIVGNNSNVTTQMYNISILHNKWFYNQSNIISISVFDVENNLVDPQSLTAYITRNNNREYEQFKKERTGIYTIKFNPISKTYKNVTINVRVKDKYKTIDREINIKLYEKNNNFLGLSLWYYLLITLFLLISLIVIIKTFSGASHYNQ